MYVDPACPLRVRFGGDSHPERRLSGWCGTCASSPTNKTPGHRRWSSAGLGPVTVHPAHSGVGPRRFFVVALGLSSWWKTWVCDRLFLFLGATARVRYGMICVTEEQ